MASANPGEWPHRNNESLWIRIPEYSYPWYSTTGILAPNTGSPTVHAIGYKADGEACVLATATLEPQMFSFGGIITTITEARIHLCDAQG